MFRKLLEQFCDNHVEAMRVVARLNASVWGGFAVFPAISFIALSLIVWHIQAYEQVWAPIHGTPLLPITVLGLSVVTGITVAILCCVVQGRVYDYMVSKHGI